VVALAPVSDPITATTRTTRHGRQAGTRQQTGGRRLAAGGRQSERTRVVLPAGTYREGSWQRAAGTRRAARWEGVSRTQVGHRDPDGLRAPSPLSLQARRYPARAWRRPALLRHAQSVQRTRCLCNYLLRPRRPAAAWPGGGLRVVSAQGPRQAVQACSAEGFNVFHRRLCACS
jgi:hypothetical protein